MPLNRSWLRLSENPIITPKLWTVQPGDAIKDTIFKPGVENVKYKTSFHTLTSAHLCEIETTNGFLTSSSFTLVLSTSASHYRINPCYTAGKRFRVQNRHATRVHLNTTSFSSTVYGAYCDFSYVYCWERTSDLVLRPLVEAHGRFKSAVWGPIKDLSHMLYRDGGDVDEGNLLLPGKLLQLRRCSLVLTSWLQYKSHFFFSFSGSFFFPAVCLYRTQKSVGFQCVSFPFSVLLPYPKLPHKTISVTMSHDSRLFGIIKIWRASSARRVVGDETCSCLDDYGTFVDSSVKSEVQSKGKRYIYIYIYIGMKRLTCTPTWSCST